MASANIADMYTTIYLGRQPIVDVQQQRVAYELLFRSGPENRALFQDDVNATASVIRHTFIDLGMSRVLEGCPGFINVNERLLKSPVLDLLPPESIILEILESVPLDDSVRERCRELQARGYRLALDDVSDITPEIQAMLPLVSYLKIDLQQVSLARLPAWRPLSRRSPGSPAAPPRPGRHRRSSTPRRSAVAPRAVGARR